MTSLVIFFVLLSAIWISVATSTEGEFIILILIMLFIKPFPVILRLLQISGPIKIHLR